jgi:MarR family transcriptional regulator, lower aerobic nicotinate degradation pathway regulator
MPRSGQNASPAPYESLWDRPGYLLRRAYQRNIALFEEECAKYFITPVQYAMLTMLTEVPRLDAVNLIKAAGVDEATGTAALRRLHTLALVERDNPRLDRRVRPVKLTDAGRQLMVESRSAMHRAQDRLVEALSPEDRLQLVALLKIVVGAGIAAERSSSSSGSRPPTTMRRSSVPHPHSSSDAV